MAQLVASLEVTMWRASSRLRALRDYQEQLGARCGLHWYLLQSLDKHAKLTAPIGIRPSRLRHRVYLRMGDSSDQHVFWQIFLKQKYDFIETLPDADTVVDLGANTGISSALFLSRWPDAKLLAVEPDPENYEMLTRNLAPYGGRAQTVRGAVWTSSGDLELSRARNDGREWARAVQRRTGSGEHVQAFSMCELMARIQAERIDLLKISIQGSELALFSGSTAWIGRVRNLAIELHDQACAETFKVAMRGYSWQDSYAGEYVALCRDLHAKNN
jgi:FkbM family methyltransferase